MSSAPRESKREIQSLFGQEIVVGAGTEDAGMAAHAFRIISSEADLQEGVEVSGPSLEDLWPEFYRFKKQRNRVEATLKNYRTALNALGNWTNHRFSKPMVPAELLTLRELESLQEWIAADGTREKQLRANHHLKQLRAIWEWGARRHLIQEPPLFPEPFEVSHTSDKTAITDEQLEKLFAACHAAKWPKGRALPPSLYWRSLIAFEAFYGIDAQSLIPWELAKVETALKLNSFTFDALSPCPFVEVENEFGWFELIRRKTKRKKPVPIYYPLNEVTRAIVERLWPPLFGRDDPPAQQLFPFPRTSKYVKSTWKDILDEAGIRPRTGGDFKLVHFRNVAANRYSTDVANYLIGHSPRGHNTITEQHYRTTLPQAVKEVNEASYPSCFGKF